MKCSVTVLHEVLSNLDAEISYGYLKKVESTFQRGKFTEYAPMASYIEFFMKCTQSGLITLESYHDLIETIFEEISHGPSFKANFLSLHLDFSRIGLLPTDLILNNRLVLLGKSLDIRRLCQDWTKLEAKLIKNPPSHAVHLDLNLPEVFMDSYIPYYATNLCHPEVVMTSKSEIKKVEQQFVAISKYFMKLTEDDLYEKAMEYLENQASLYDERFLILQNCLLSFLPHSRTEDNFAQIQYKNFMLEFDSLSTLQKDVIKPLTQRLRMIDRLLVWFKEERCHSFIIEFGEVLLGELDMVILVEMGPSIWNYLEKLNLIPVIDSLYLRIPNHIQIPYRNYSSEMFLSFFRRL